MFIGTHRMVCDPISLSAVIQIQTPRVKARDVELLFVADYAPERIEIIDARPNKKIIQPFSEAENEARQAACLLRAEWPAARLCVIVTSGVVTSKLAKPIVANMALATRNDFWVWRTLNQKWVEKTLQGKSVPYPVSNRETKTQLYQFVLYMLKPLKELRQFVQSSSMPPPLKP
jgi:hypothetical protein